MQNSDVFICGAVRTPHGAFRGALKDISSARLGGAAIKGLLVQAGISSSAIDEVHMGQVYTAGEGQNPARYAALYARLPARCAAETHNKVCASSLAALRHAAYMIRLGEAGCVIAGGQENMSRAPYLLSRQGKKAGSVTLGELVGKRNVHGNIECTDSMIVDGLTDPAMSYHPHMGALADSCAALDGISRADQEEYARESLERTHGAPREHARTMLVSVSQGGEIYLAEDEGVRTASSESIQKLPPAFTKAGTVTAGTSSRIVDGASALLLANIATAEEHKLTPLARIRRIDVWSGSPSYYPIAPVHAISKTLYGARLSVDDIDLFEVNEAFATVPLHAMIRLNIPHSKMNVWGGAIAIGHPLGASGTRIIGTLAHALVAREGRYGIAAACNGGGEAVSVLLERV